MATISFEYESGITARAGGGFPLATALTKQLNSVDTVATAGDSVVLPAIVAGKTVKVRNNGANYLNVYPPGVIVDGGSPPAAFKIQPGHEVTFTPYSATEYKTDNPATGEVTQITSITTGVTLNALKGIITTVAATAGASGATPNVLTVTNSFAQADSNIYPYILDSAGTGNAAVSIDNRLDGSFDIKLSSFSAAALDGVHKIGFEIKN